ncbi:hypothetical protein D3C80_1411830 [compost metagenome]
MEDQQRLAGDATADESLAYGGKPVTTLGIGQGHVQLADLEQIDVRHRQLHEHAQQPGQQGRSTAHGDVDHLTEGIEKVDRGIIAERRHGQFTRAVSEQPQALEGLSEQIRVSRLLHEGQRPKRHDPLQRLLLNIAGHHNDLARQTFALQGSQYLIAVHLRHGQVEQHHIGLPLAQNRHGLHAVGGLRDGDRPVGR